MEVTKQNLQEALEELKPLLENADFISLDLELSGLGRSRGSKLHELDTSRERYEKVLSIVKEYTLIQIGITIFRFCKQSEKFFHATFCFYLLGDQNSSYRFDPSSVHFLASNGFNFNKLFLDGISFISIAEEINIREKKEEKLKRECDNSSSTQIKLKDEKARTFNTNAVRRIHDAINQGQNSVLFEGKDLNPLFRKILFTNVAQAFPSNLVKTSHPSFDVRITLFESEEKKRNHIEKEWTDELNKKLGFTHVVKAILQAGKPIVGHNMLLDVMYFVHNFISPLPDDMKDFKSLVSANMPPIYDTKLIWKDPPFYNEIVNSALGSLFEGLMTEFSPPTFEVESGYHSYKVSKSGQHHDGGYDAFMTGACFATMLNVLEGKNWLKNDDIMSSSYLKNFAYKVNFMMSYDIPCINLRKDDDIPDRRFIYHMICPSSYSNADVRKIFGALRTFKTVWVNDTELFIIPQEGIDVKKPGRLMSSIQSSCPPNVKISMYRPSAQPRTNKIATTQSSGTCVHCSANLDPSNEINSEPIVLKSRTLSLSEDSSTETPNLKRLKSVGSELLSSMTLSSPVIEDADMVNKLQTEDKSGNAVSKTIRNDFFSAPDEW